MAGAESAAVGPEIYDRIPEFRAKDSSRTVTEGKVTDRGGRVYNKRYDGVTADDYESYLGTLEESGFVKYADNAGGGLVAYVRSASYTKDDLTVTAIYAAKVGCVYLSVGKDNPLSEHLFPGDGYTAGNLEGARHVLYMPELYFFGDSYVMQMKNGHFLLIDGGMKEDTPYLFDFLDSLVPKGQKPVVEGWLVTHGHADHIGPFYMMLDDPSYAGRAYVEGIYYSDPNRYIVDNYNGGCDARVEEAAALLKNMKGEETKVYRPQTGQRYYFNDITIDIMHTQDQLPIENYTHGQMFNDTSTWFLFTVDGQTFLDAGDAYKESVNVVKETYDREVLDFDLMSVLHHGQNVFDSYIDYFKYKVAIYPTFSESGLTSTTQLDAINERLKANAAESLSWREGGKVLVLPYEIGTSRTLPMRQWIYHPDRKPPVRFRE